MTSASLNDPRIRGAVYQIALVAVVGWVGYGFAVNVRENLQTHGIATGFDFLSNSAGFGVNQTLISYTESDTYARVFVVGLLNTLLVSMLGIMCATMIGMMVGIARLSDNWLIARIAGAYVEIVRNLPLLFQILFWYLAVLGTFPVPRASIGIGLQPVVETFSRLAGHAAQASLLAPLRDMLLSLGAHLADLADRIGPPDIYVNNRGLFLPHPAWQAGALPFAAALIVAIVAALIVRAWARRRREATGRGLPAGRIALALILGLPLIALVAFGRPVSFDPPVLRGFNFVGGLRLFPEFVALLVALSTYTAAFIAEIVRAGILGIPRGQTEAAYSLGLRPRPTMRLIVLPQALRIIIPPLTSQYLNLIKNSSLAVAIGYPDLFAVFAGTTLNQTGQAIEIIAMTMAVYLAISLVTSLGMNLYNSRVRLVER